MKREMGFMPFGSRFSECVLFIENGKFGIEIIQVLLHMKPSKMQNGRKLSVGSSCLLKKAVLESEYIIRELSL